MVLVDPSGSGGGPAAAHRALGVVAGALTGHVGPKPTNQGSTPGTSSVRLWVRRVASDSYAESATVAEVTIPGVPALSARPDYGDAAATTDFLRQVMTARQAWTVARTSSQAAATRLQALELPSQNSDIAGAVSASADLLQSATGRRVLLVVSDLEQAGSPSQSAGSLKGIDVVVAQVCVKGAHACQLARSRFTTLVRRLGSTTPTYLRPESLRDTVPSLLEDRS